MQGIVYLVGAGPGDYKLISLRALEYIKTADVVVYDRLADDRLLAFADPAAELIYVGKASNRHTMRQEDINRLLVDQARSGKTVVRLKGGDPLVFGRGGEEAAVLLENGVPFEFVPGITSAVAVPAYAGIPVTHRGVAASFAVVTGHEDPVKTQSTIRWDKLATAVDTLVFLMGVENLPFITERLIEHGRPAATPAALIRWGTKPEQEVFTTTVGEAAADAARRGLKPPAIFIVGEVVHLRRRLAWFDQKPLFGKTVLVTRAREQASMLTSRLEKLGAGCLEAPAIRIEEPSSFAALDAALEKLDGYDWLIFTSVNGAERFFRRLNGRNRDARALAAAKIVAIGAPTAQKLQTFGVRADFVPGEFRAEGVIELLKPLARPGQKVLIPRAEKAREILPESLRGMGLAVDVAPAYRTAVGDADGAAVAAALAAGRLDVVTFTSSSTVDNLLKLLGGDGPALLRRAEIACIGPITADACRRGGVEPTIVAAEYTIPGLVAAIEAKIGGHAK